MRIRILTDKPSMTSLEVMLASQKEAEVLVGMLFDAGFRNPNIMQTSGIKDTGHYQVHVATKKDGTVSEIVAFLENHPDIDYGE